jgi:hypothetical protein
MAKQTGLFRMRGTMDGVTFYQMGGKDFARARSSINGRRFKGDKVFEGSRQSSRRFGQGNRIAGMVYRSSGCVGHYPLFCALKKRAIGLLKEGFDEDVILKALQVMALRERRISCKKKSTSRLLHDTEAKPFLKNPESVFDPGFWLIYAGINRAIKSTFTYQCKRRRERYGRGVRAG